MRSLALFSIFVNAVSFSRSATFLFKVFVLGLTISLAIDDAELIDREVINDFSKCFF